MAAAKATRRRRAPRRSRDADATASAAIRAAGEAIHALETLGAPFALIGGQAVSARTEPRFTEDVDLAVSVTGDAQAQSIVFALSQSGWAVQTVIEQEATGRLATVRLTPPREKRDVFVDLLFASSGIEPETVSAATPLDLLGHHKLRVASVGHLIALKVLSESNERLQDRIDLRKLIAVSTPRDLKVARGALKLISKRGFARGRNLLGALRRFSK